VTLPVTRAHTPARVAAAHSTPGSWVSLAAVLLLGLAGCGDHARLLVRQGMGPNPTLPPPVTPLIPTVAIAPAL
jgi:hypothetical protein